MFRAIMNTVTEYFFDCIEVFRLIHETCEIA